MKEMLESRWMKKENWPISDRILLLEISGKPFNISLILACVPTADKYDEEFATFYTDIELA